jgi:hypothetical protein
MTAATGGVEGFIEGLSRCGVSSQQRDGFVFYAVEAVDGGRAGVATETAVEAAELERWPLVPPHWIHLPGNVVFGSTNSRPSPIDAWIQHSRQIAAWGQDSEPAQGWLAHVRAVIGEAR